MSTEFLQFCERAVIHRQLTAPHTPHQNGVVETMNRIIFDRAHTMALDAHLLVDLWPEVVSTAVYLINISLTRSNVGTPPIQTRKGKLVDLKHLKVFGCLAYSHVRKEKSTKMDPQGNLCMMGGYDSASKAYVLYDLDKQKIIVTKVVQFNESEMAFVQHTDLRESPTEMLNFLSSINDKNISHTDPQQEDKTPTKGREPTMPHPAQDDDPAPQSLAIAEPQPTVHQKEREHTNTPVPTRHSMRTRTAPIRYRNYIFSTITATPEPEIIEIANKHLEWCLAMEEEYDSLILNGTWVLKPLTEGKTSVTTKWVFCTKISADQKKEKLKAWLVAQGFQQRPSIDFDETFSPTVKWKTKRIMTALAARKAWQFKHLDVKAAYLNGNIKEEVFMTQPQGFIKQGQVSLVCRLKKAVYGLEQSGRAWYLDIDNFL